MMMIDSQPHFDAKKTAGCSLPSVAHSLGYVHPAGLTHCRLRAKSLVLLDSILKMNVFKLK